jgi:hypothetical protein
MKQFENSFNQEFPELPEPIFLFPTPLLETADYTVEDMVHKNAEDSC